MSDALPRPASSGISDLEVKDGQFIFASVWSSLEREFGREKLAFPREIFWLNGHIVLARLEPKSFKTIAGTA